MKLLSACLIAVLICGIAFAGALQFGTAQIGTNVSGIIASDTTWTLANNPYNFTNSVSVNKGVALTIEPGVTVDLNLFTLQINGTLYAVGTSNSPIQFGKTVETTYNVNTGTIIVGNNWNESSSSGTIIENTYGVGVFGIQTYNTSPTITNNSGDDLGIGVDGGSPIITDNTLGDLGISGGSPVISNNTIVSWVSSGFGSKFGIFINGPNNALIYDNYISDFSQSGIVVAAGTPVIERNLISDSGLGMAIYGNTNPVIENNTFAENSIGLNIYNSNGSPSPTITNNNFEQNSQYNIYLGQQGVSGSTAGNVNAANNWWGNHRYFSNKPNDL